MTISVKPLSEDARQASHDRWNHVAKPLKSLGRFEQMISDIAAIQGTADVSLSPRCVLVFCGDHGVVRRNISQSTSDVTRRVAETVACGSSNINLMARCAHADVLAIDMGMVEPLNLPQIILRRHGNGTNDISAGPAMTVAQAEAAIQDGIALVGDMQSRGYRLIATGEMGIGNTTSAAALACALLDLPIETAAGRGAGLSDAGLERKKAVIREALAVNKSLLSDPVSCLAALGGFEIAGMTGAFLGGAKYGMPIVIDGVISAVAALLSARICPQARAFMFPSHMGRETISSHLMDALGLQPVIYGDLALGEGTGAVMLFPLLDMALSVYSGTHTFDALHMEAYTPQGGLS